MTSMRDCIAEQPDTYRRILGQEATNLAAFTDLVRDRQINRILFLATGSSWNAVTCALPYLEAVAEVSCTLSEPYPFLLSGPPRDPVDLVIAVSQRGTSSATIDAVRQAKDWLGVPVVVLTGHPESPIVELADTVVDIGCGPEEIAFSTKGVTATILTTMLVGLNLAQTPVPESLGRPALASATAQAAITIKKAEVFYRKNQEVFDLAERIFIIGYGPNYGTAREAETKFTETVRVPSSGEELESFMHGPIFEVHQNYLIFLTEIPGTTAAPRSARLAEFLNRYCRNVHPVSLGAASSATGLSLGLAEVDEKLSPLLLVLVYQVFSERLSSAKGYDLTIPVFPDFKPFMGTKVIY